MTNEEARETCEGGINGGMAKILVWIKEPFKKARHVWISPTLENLQKTIDGYIETVRIATDLLVICDEEALLTDKKYNVTVGGVQIFGTAIMIGQQGEEFASCPVTADQMKRMFPKWMEEAAGGLV